MERLADEELERMLHTLLQTSDVLDAVYDSPIRPVEMIGIEVYNNMLREWRLRRLRDEIAYMRLYMDMQRRLTVIHTVMSNSRSVEHALSNIQHIIDNETFSPPRTKATEKHIDPCSICINDIKQDDEISILPCGHNFHFDCIVPWFDSGKNTCPLCRDMCGEVGPAIFRNMGNNNIEHEILI